MKKFRKVWDDGKKAFLKATKGLPPKDAYATFLAAYPECEGDVTEAAFQCKRSELGASGEQKPSFRREPRPVGAEQVKKGYVRIKVAQPNVWMSKAKWVYMNAHPDEDLSERSHYVFLDGDSRNFAPENVGRVPTRCLAVFNSMGGCERGRPDETALRIARARLKVAMLDRGERLGLVSSMGPERRCRRFREDVNASARAYRARPYVKERIRENRKAWYERLKQDPERHAAWRAKRREYAREWARRRKERKESER